MPRVTGPIPAYNSWMQDIRVAVFGEYNEQIPGHRTIGPALRHSGYAISEQWIPTTELQGASADHRLAGFDGYWAAPGSPYASFDGMLRGIQFARERDLPFLGTCGGFQYALIEFARNVLGIENANSAENEPGDDNIVITPISCPAPNRGAGDPRLVGINTLSLVPGTRTHEFFGRDTAGEAYFCNFEVNPAFEQRLTNAGIVVGARGPQNEIRSVELHDRTFFFASLFQPQLTSTPENPHPLITAFARAAVAAADPSLCQ